MLALHEQHTTNPIKDNFNIQKFAGKYSAFKTISNIYLKHNVYT